MCDPAGGDGVEIGIARPEEFESVGQLTADAYVADGLASGTYVDELRDARARAEAGLLLVARDRSSGDLLGTASLFTWRAPARWSQGAQTDEAVLRMLAVAPHARRRGVGRLLASDCLRRSAELRCRRLVLVSATTMTAAHALYEQLGFIRDPARDRSPQAGVTLLAYHRAVP
ncbi:MAG: GNAT family N-acetyltransferase [Acidimicrobiales bacterium]